MTQEEFLIIATRAASEGRTFMTSVWSSWPWHVTVKFPSGYLWSDYGVADCQENAAIASRLACVKILGFNDPGAK